MLQNTRTTPMRVPSNPNAPVAGEHVDIGLSIAVQVAWTFKTDADRLKFEALEPEQRETLRSVFDGSAAALLERAMA